MPEDHSNREPLRWFWPSMCTLWIGEAILGAVFAAFDDGRVWALDRLTTAVGGLVPKAIWYSGYFASQGRADFAAEIRRMYGFCTLLFCATIAIYVCVFLARGRSAAEELPGELKSRPAQSRLSYIENLGIGAAIVTAYYSFVGFGLEPSGRFPSELTSGKNVLFMPAITMPMLVVWIIYILNSHRYLTRFKSSER